MKLTPYIYFEARSVLNVNQIIKSIKKVVALKNKPPPLIFYVSDIILISYIFA